MNKQMEVDQNKLKTGNTDKDQEKNEKIEDAQGNSKSKTWGQTGEKIEYRMDMDEIMDRLDVPYKKITKMENAYLFAVNTKEQIEEIVLKIQTLTKVTWSVKQTRKFEQCLKKKPKRPMTVFKRQYGCHMSTRTRTKTRQLRKKKSRNINCPAKLLVTIKTYLGPPKVRQNLTNFDKDFPCMFEFRNHHNHLVDIVDVLTTRPLGDDIKDTIFKLLDKGHSCVSAYHTLYTLKVEEFGDEYKTKMADRHYFPKRNDIATMYKLQSFREKYELFAELSFTVRNLESILNLYQKKNGTLYRLSIKDDTVVVCLCTPLMQRSIQQNCDIIFIDPSSDDFKDYKSYFVLTQTAVGALPISCILSNKHDISAFTSGIKMFVEMSNIEPTLILTTGTILTELIDQNTFPNSKILFSFYHALSSAWKCLYDTRHEIARAKKESYYQLFREVVFADNEEGLVVARQVLAVECAQPKFLAYIDQMYENIQLWCLYYRQFMVLPGPKAVDFNEAEVSFRLFRLIRKVPMERTKLFNINHITDFICSAFEKYLKGRILEMVFDKNSQVLIEKYGPKCNSDPRIEDVGHHQYLFSKSLSETPNEYYHQVDMITLLCTCSSGILGKHCEHVAFLLAHFNVFSPNLTVEQKSTSYFIATGSVGHKKPFLQEQNGDIDDEDEKLCSSPETVLGAENLEVQDAVPNLEATKSKWMSYCNKIVELMEDNPAKFLPAVNSHLGNIENFATSIQSLLKGLYAGFPYMGHKDNLPPLAIIDNRSSIKKNQKQSNSPQNSTFGLNKPLTAPPRTIMKTDRKQETNVHPYRQVPEGINRKEGEITKMVVATSSSSSSKSTNVANCEEVIDNISVLKCRVENHVHSQDKNTKLSLYRPMSERALDRPPSGKVFNFNIMPASLENVSEGNTTGMVQIQRGVLVDQIAHGKVSVFDEKKGILIIPMDTRD